MELEEANKVLEELNTLRPEKLDKEAKRLFDAIMLIADERDELKERVDSLINEVTLKQCELEKKDKIIDLMAEQLTTDYHSKEWVIDYFTKKVEE